MADLYENSYYDTGSTARLATDDNVAGQSFTPTEDHTITYIQLYFLKEGDPPEPLYLELYAGDEDGFPTGPVLASASVAPGDVPSDYDWVSLTLDSETTVLSGNKYVFIFWTANGSFFSADYKFSFASFGDPYPNGDRIKSDDYGVSWEIYNNVDWQFRIYGNPYVPPTPSVPPAADINPDAFTGYHCFREQFQKRRAASLIPYKKPDGTLYRDAP